MLGNILLLVLTEAVVSVSTFKTALWSAWIHTDSFSVITVLWQQWTWSGLRMLKWLTCIWYTDLWMEMDELQWKSIDSAFPATCTTTPNIRTSASSESQLMGIDGSAEMALWPGHPGHLTSRVWVSSSDGVWSSWCMKPLWKQKKTSSLELPSLLLTLRTYHKSSNGHESQWSNDVLRAYRPMATHSSSSCECHCCN